MMVFSNRLIKTCSCEWLDGLILSPILILYFGKINDFALPFVVLGDLETGDKIGEFLELINSYLLFIII